MSDIKKFVFAERQKALDVASLCGLGILEEDTELEGYRIYIVEQWMCDRKTHANTVKVFTGDKTHKIKVCVIGITTADLQHARPDVKRLFSNSIPLKYKSTPKGQILLTDPSELPYDMDMVLIPDGDYDKWVRQACVNINLRRTNCTGRSAFNLRKPNPASEEKFRSLYKIADAVTFEDAVINLVTLAQTALYLFNLLRRDCVDGLICDETNAAFGEYYRKYQPYKGSTYTLKESWMEPHLLTSLITKLVVCRNKLHSYNFTTVKDPFVDWDEFADDIGNYQRIKGLRQTKVIDLDTLKKLDEYHIGPLRVRKAIKSKLDDISGINNYPLFGEDYNPEVFRDHATIDSLRAIWRPRLKNSLGTDSDKQPHELLHLIKEVSARTTKTSGAAAEILSKVAGSLSWGSNNSPSEKNAPSLIKNSSNISGGGGSSRHSHHASTFSCPTSQLQSPVSHMSMPSSSAINGDNTSSISGPIGVTDDLIVGRSSKDLYRKGSMLGRKDISSNSEVPSTPIFTESPSQMKIRNTVLGPHEDDDLPTFLRSDSVQSVKNQADQHFVSPSPSPSPSSSPSPSPSPSPDDYLTSDLHSASAVTHPSSANELGKRQEDSSASPEQIGGGDFVRYKETRLASRLERSQSVDENSLLSFRSQQRRRHHVTFKDTRRSSDDNYKDKHSWWGVRQTDDSCNPTSNNTSNDNDNDNGSHKNNDSDDDDDYDDYDDSDDDNEDSEDNEGNEGNDDNGDDNDDNDNDSNSDRISVFSAPDCNKVFWRRRKSVVVGSQRRQAHTPLALREERQVDLETRLDDIVLTSQMDIETYLLYERLRQQHSELEQKYQQLQLLAKGYEEMAKQLRATYIRRSGEFEQIERQFKLIVDDQMGMEKQLKQVEDDSAKLHYELNVLNDNLMEREENVAGFYSKLEALEKKMRDDQQSLTTIFIMGNFFKYYWQKVASFIGWAKD